MSMNKFMHSRNIYKTPPDFKQLAIEYEDFRKVSKMKPDGTVHIDFSDEEALRTLTKCLLRKDFNLDVSLPPNQLIPTLPLRLNYILWIEDIMNTFNFSNVAGIDIGCGASCIYPLLAVRQNADWHMYATEVNEESINWARENVNRNGLENQITILECSENLVENLNRHTNSFNFTMCNPPFFNDDDPPNEQLKNRTGKRKSANNAKTGIQCELSTAGGEVEFVKEMIEQSAVLKERVKIFTSMLGQKISINKIVNELKSHGIHNFCITEFCQGRTTRWGIAWTLDNCLLLRTVPCIGQSQPKSVIYLELDTSNKKKINEELVDIFENLCDATSRNRMEKITEKQFHFIAFVNSWSNQRRKRREQQRNMQNSKIDDEEPAEKRLKVDPWKQEATLLLHVEVTIQPKDDAFTLCEEILLKYLNGSSGLNGIHELSQFIQNKWNSK